MPTDYLTGGANLPATGMGTVQGNPFETMLQEYVSATPEKKIAGIQKLATQFPGGPQQVFGVNPTAPQQLPGQAPVQEEPTSAWSKFMEFSKANPQFLLDVGAQLLAPRNATVSPMSHIATGVNTAMNRLQQRKAAAKEAELAERKVKATESLAAAQVGKMGAEQTNIERTTPALGLNDRLIEAKIHKLLADAASAKGSVNKELNYDRAMAEVLAKVMPDQYKNADEAFAAWGKFKVNKGNDATAKAMVAAMENLPYLPENRQQATLDLIKEQMKGIGGVEAGYSITNPPPAPKPTAPAVESIPAEEWKKLIEGSKDYAAAVELFGKETVDAMMRKYK